MNSMPPHRPEHHYEEISLLAYHLWQQAHCPPGEDLKFWLQAEQQLFGKREPKSATKQKAPASQKAAGNGKTATQRAASAAGKAPAKSQPKAAKQQARAQ